MTKKEEEKKDLKKAEPFAFKNWTELIKPTKIDVNKEEKTNVGSVVIEPLERGFGLTIGNSLRRILLSSLQGAAVTSVQIDGVLHEFTSVPGMIEDVTEFILNIKSLALKLNSDQPKKMMLKVNGPGEVKASQIEASSEIEIINKDLILCNLNKSAKLNLEFTVQNGKGYVPAEHQKKEDKEIGLILVDSIFSPVKKVSYKIENSRVGQVTDFDKLTLNVETNGAMEPEDAVAMAARILQEQLQYFINFEEPEIDDKSKEEEAEIKFNRNLLRKVDELELSVRSANCLRNDNIVYIGDLVQKSENDMLRTPNFGRKSLNEIREVLMQMGLNLGMDITDWPPENIEELSKNLDDNL
ncbi:MAG: DNA-directed RNA polymerase subunit alpha [Alphaproteobacteria bacterium MarineAlpha6_Bin4]|nr:MAG: DNA-directed RNA polymerase subunit alpha [Alphaproteobacteria bacterium MarineAlpha6_Bin3]PPR38317.1 MAG: DNA-directed RNA polymerase subunit alpha [Alphaproteobacteria bacterium MarineAlpha6_Bin4]|tara:strand:+ start:24225 stop:25289 length:1065 start_codon:yes stop_codon:yes gene_type:complete